MPNPPLPEALLCHPSLSLSFPPVTTACSPGVTGCISVACPPFSMTNLPPALRGPILSLARPLSVLGTTANVPAYPSLLSLPPNPNGLSCCNCAGHHPFAYCTQPTMLQIIARGKFPVLILVEIIR